MLKRVILTLIFLLLNTLTYGQKKTPVLQHISSYIITGSDTIKIQRYNGAEYHKLIDIAPKSYGIDNYTIIDAVLNIQAYLEARSQGEIPDNPDEIESRFNNLTSLAKVYKVYFDLENYKKELSYYKTEEEKTKARIKEYNEQVKRNSELERKRIADILLARKKADSLYLADIKQKAISDSIHYENQKKINDFVEKEKRKKENRKQIATKKQKIEIQKINKLETKKKQKQETKINLTIQVSGNSKR
ncbi:hypothetical protein [Flavobacterium sp. LB2R40]|uniref:hypothetical protein n=1 Tax=Flavobacterium sp. LB2R40 TaxID=3401722 RepID=UPI003AAF672A